MHRHPRCVHESNPQLISADCHDSNSHQNRSILLNSGGEPNTASLSKNKKYRLLKNLGAAYVDWFAGFQTGPFWFEFAELRAPNFNLRTKLVTMELTEAQRALMAQNRAKALARKAAKQQQKEDEEYAMALRDALLENPGEHEKTDAEVGEDTAGNTAEVGNKNGEPSAGIEEDPYMCMDSMDEDTDEEESDESEGFTTPLGRGSYSTIAVKNKAVQDFFVSGLTTADYVETHPDILASTLDKWVDACAKEQWPDFLARCSVAEATSAKKIPNWYRSVANAVAIADGKEQPFSMKLGRKRFLHKFEYLQHLVEELTVLIQQRRHLKEKVDLKSVVHTLKKMVKEKETELQSQGICCSNVAWELICALA